MSKSSAPRAAKTRDFTKGPILVPMLIFTLPILLGDIFSSLYNVVDSVVVGQYVGAKALAAVGSSFAINMVCVAVFAGFGMGSSIVVGQLFGAKRWDDVNKAVSTAFIGAMIVGTTMAIVGLVISRPILELLKTPADIIDDSTIYLRIVFLGVPGQLFYYMGSAITRGLGDSKWPMYFLIVCSVLNIVLDLLFVLAFNMGCAGVALATVIAQYISAVMVVLRILKGGYGVQLNKTNFRLYGHILKMIIRIGVPSAIQQMTNSVGLLIIQSYANGFGADFVAANSIIQKVDSFALMPLFAMSQTVTMFTAQNLGAGLNERANRGGRISLALAASCGLVVSVAAFLLARPLNLIFLKSTEVAAIEMGTQAVRILAFFYLVVALQRCFAFIMQGAGAATPIMLISIACVVLRVPITYLCAVRTGNYEGMFWATNIYNVLFTIGCCAYYIFGDWHKYVAVKKAPSEEKPALEEG